MLLPGRLLAEPLQVIYSA